MSDHIEPGLYWATVDGKPGQLIRRSEIKDDWRPIYGGPRLRTVTDQRPAQVVAPDEVAVKVEDLRAQIRPGNSLAYFGYTRNLRDAVDAWDAAQRPTKPDEPLELGAAVLTRDNRLWVRDIPTGVEINRAWISRRRDEPCSWDELDVVEVVRL